MMGGGAPDFIFAAPNPLPGGMPDAFGSASGRPRGMLSGGPPNEGPSDAESGGGSAGELAIGTSGPPPDISTRVYPLAAIGSFEELKDTLDDVLATSGVPPEQVKLAYHDKTNVLILRGPAEAHAAVEELLAAIGKNAARINERDGLGKNAALEMEIKVMQADFLRLRKQLDQTEAERRELEKVNQRLQDQLATKSDRK